MGELSRVFRVFISSSFRDFKEERNALHRTVFPRVEALCRRHGYHFQPIDLRWGVRDEATLDHQTMAICLEELRRCQRVSPRLHFLLLLGDRYGWRPLPTPLPRSDFEALREALPAAGRARLDAWYCRDDNALPESVYDLRPREGAYRDAAAWGAVESALRADFDAAAEAIFPAGDERRVRYCGSATHQEILHGLFVDPPPPNAFCYLRTMRDLPPNAGDFNDLSPDGTPDARAKAALGELKIQIEKRSPNTVHHYRLGWADVPRAAAYSSLCEQIEADLTAALMREIQASTGTGELDSEAARHRATADRHRRHFVGRTDVLAELATHAVRPAGQRVVVGAPGSGKSALLARASAVPGPPGAVRVVRFLGTTATASDPRTLLESLCREIGRAYADPREVPREASELAADFQRRLGLATEARPLLLWLDALDQVGGGSLEWLPVHLPPHVQLTVSTPPGPILARLERRMSGLARVEVGPLPAADGERLLDLWLSDAERTLQPAQRDEVLTRFAACPLPLYLKLAFEQARRWKSHAPRETIGLRPDVLGLIDHLYDWLAAPRRHGQELVSRELGFLAASRHGLSEDELLRSISADDEYVRTFLAEAHHDLPQANPLEFRLPVILWSRLYHDLEPYLTEQADAGVPLLTFYHRQLSEAAARRFLCDDADAADRHRVLALAFRRLADPTHDATWQTSVLRPLRELPHHLHGYAVRSGLCAPLYVVLDDESFRQALFVRAGRPEPLLEGLHLALDRATVGGDPIHTVRYALARLNLNGSLAARYLPRLDRLAETNPDLARAVADLSGVPPTMRMLGLLLVAWIVADHPDRRPLAREICTGLGAREDSWFDATQVALVLGIVKELALREIPEAGAVLDRVPACPLREVTRRAWEQGPPPLAALAARLARPVACVIDKRDIARMAEIQSLVREMMQGRIRLHRGTFDELGANFGRDGPVAFAVLFAAQRLDRGDRDLARVAMNRSIFEGTALSPRPLRAFLAVRDRVAEVNPDLASEFHDRTESGLGLMAKIASTPRAHGEQARLTALHERQALTSRVRRSAEQRDLARQAQAAAPDDVERPLDALTLAMVALAAEDTATAGEALAEVDWSGHARWPVTDHASLLLAGYALARATGQEMLLAPLRGCLQSAGLEPEAVFRGEGDFRRAEVIDILLRGDPVALEAVAFALRLDGRTPEVYTLVRDACQRGSSEAAVDALLGQIIRSPDLAVSEVQNVADELTNADRNLGVPAGLGVFYFPFVWAFGLWSGLLLLGVGWAGREVVPGAVPVLLLGGAALLDLLAWSVIGVWERPERSRRWSAFAGSITVAAAWGTYLYLDRGGTPDTFRSQVAGTTSWLAVIGLAFVAYRLGTRGWLFQPDGLRRQVGGTVVALIGAVILTIFSNLAVSVLGDSFLAGLWLAGSLLVGIGIHAFVKFIPVRRLCWRKGIRLENTGPSPTEKELS